MYWVKRPVANRLLLMGRGKYSIFLWLGLSLLISLPIGCDLYKCFSVPHPLRETKKDWRGMEKYISHPPGQLGSHETQVC